MNRLIRSTLAVGLVTAGLLPFGAAQADLDKKYDPSRVKIPDLNEIQTVEPERYELANGAVIYLLENHDLPVVSGQAYFRASSAWEPADKVGLASITGQVIRSGGTAEHPGDWIDDRLAAIGASMSTSIGADFATATFRCLSENRDEVLSLLAEVVQQPAFPEEKIEIAKNGAKRGIAARNDELLPLLQRVAGQAVFGEDSPYARNTEYATIAAIQQSDLAAFHKLSFVPNRMIFAVYGDFESAAMKQQIEAAFGSWARDDSPTPEMPPMPGLGEPRVVYAPKDDATNTGIVVGHVGFKADAPDAADMEVCQNALGGGFQSRLFNIIRTQRGLAYATGATSGSGFFRPGVFLAFSLTQVDSTMAALDIVREQVRLITQEEITEEELDAAKNSALNSFVFNFEQPDQVLFRAAFYELAGYPQDYLTEYQKGLEEVSRGSVLAAAQHHIHPDNGIIVLVGKEEEFDRPLESLGLPVERVDITIPPPAAEFVAEEATPEALAKGGEWLAAAATTAGGSDDWSKVEAVAVERKGTLSIQGQQIGMTGKTSWTFPGKRRDDLELPVGTIIQATDGQSAWRNMMGQVSDAPELVKQTKKGFETSFYRLFRDPSAIEIQALSEPQTIDGASYQVAYVRNEMVTDWLIFFDAEGRIARMEYMGDGPAGPAKQTEIYSDWRPVGGVQLPHSRTVLMDGEPFLTETISSYELNPSFTDEVFSKPSS